MAKAEAAAPKPRSHTIAFGELDGVRYTPAELDKLRENATQARLEKLVVTYTDGRQGRPYRFISTGCDLEVSADGKHAIIDF